MNIIFSPIALFAYNRPEHTRKTLQALSKCPEYIESPLYVFCDGAKDSKDQVLVSKTRDVIDHLVGSHATVIQASENQGLANSIIKGVTQLVDKYGRVIVLEDDLIVTPGFLKYMNDALETYHDSPEVMQVSGYMFPVPELVGLEDALFLPFTVSWGWGTWKRAWDCFDSEAKNWRQLRHDSKARKKFNLDGACNYSLMLTQQMTGKIDSWAVRWYWSVFQRNGYVVFPPETFVLNTGFDGSGTHGSLSAKKLKVDELKTHSTACYSLPREISVNEYQFYVVKKSLRATQTVWINQIKSLISSMSLVFN